MRVGRRYFAVACAVAAAWPAGAAAAPTVTEYTAGLTPGFSVNGIPQSIAAGYRAPPTATTRARPPLAGGLGSGLDGSLWFTEAADPGRVGRLAPDGTVTERTGGVTPGFSANGQPAGIAAVPGGDVWFVQTLGARVAHIAPGRGVTELTGGVTPGLAVDARPQQIARGPDGAMWFTDNAGVGRVNADGTVTTYTGGVTPGLSLGPRAQGLTAGPDGALWFTESHQPGRIGRITSAGAVTEYAGGVTPGFTKDEEPWDIAVGPDGNLWFTEFVGPGVLAGILPAIGRITPAGQVTEFRAGISADAFPRAIAAGPDGNLWFTEGFGVARITPAGIVTEFHAGSTPGLTAGAYDITAGPDGAMWFTEESNPGRIGRITVGPGVTTGAATAAGTSSVTLAGSVRPNGQASSYRFEYGRTTAYGAQTDEAAAGAALTAHAVSAAITGLQPGTLYHYRLTATNASATTVGSDATFRTQAAPGSGGSGGSGGQTGAGGGAGGGGQTGGGNSSPGATGAARLTRLRVHPRRFSAGRRRVRVTFRLDRAARVRFVVRHAGRRVLRLRRTGRAGADRVRLRVRRLAPGRYRLVARTRGGRAVRARFRITR